MEREASILVDVTVAFAIALAGGWLAVRLRLPSILGYIAAGLVISPFTPGFVGDTERLRAIADVGVLLLLFAIGVQFSLRDLAAVGPLVIAAAAGQIVVLMTAGALLARSAGLSHDDAVYLGAAVSVSSSAVLVKLLDTRGDAASAYGRLAVAWSIVQDFFVVGLMVVLPALTEDGAGGLSPGGVLVVLGKVAGFVGVVFLLGPRIVPFLLTRVAEERSRELFFLAVATVAIGTAVAAERSGLSLALGGFLAGILVSESDLSHRVLGDLLPTRDVFAVLFFVSAGMLVDPAIVRDQWPAALATVTVIVVLKPVLVALPLALLGRSWQTSVMAAGVLMPAGEFSFVVAGIGLDRGVVSNDAFGTVLVAAVGSIAVSPLVVAGVERWAGRVPGALRVPSVPRQPSRIGRHAVVVGYGRVGQIVASLLAARFTVLIVEDDRRAAQAARKLGLDVVEGNPTAQPIIDAMRLPEARVLIITMQDPFAARLLTERAREINPHLEIIGRALSPRQEPSLRRSGMSLTVVAEDEVGFELARFALHRMGVSSPEALRAVQAARQRSS